MKKWGLIKLVPILRKVSKKLNKNECTKEKGKINKFIVYSSNSKSNQQVLSPFDTHMPFFAQRNLCSEFCSDQSK